MHPKRSPYARKNMQKSSFVKAATSMAAAAIVAAQMVAPVMAEGKTYTPVAGTNTTFTHIITLDENAKVPNEVISYAVSAGNAIAATDTTMAVYSGTDSLRTNGQLPTIADLTFTADDAHDEGETTVTKTATVDLSGVEFKEPGVYRYVITESGSAQGVTEDEDRVLGLDVYVIDDGGTLKVVSYALHDNENAAAPKTGDEKLADKVAGTEAELKTSDLTISKKVAGNRGSQDEYFPITVKISKADKGTKFNVDLSNADATTKITGANAETHTNPSELTADENGDVTQVFWVQHGQSIIVRGISGETAYSTSEDAGDYTPSIVVTGDTTNSTVDGGSASDTELTEDTEVAYTNTRDGVINTGVVMSVGAGALVGLAGLAGVAYKIVGKKKEDEE